MVCIFFTILYQFMARVLTKTEGFAILADHIIVLAKDGTLEYSGPPRDWVKFASDSKNAYHSLVSDSPVSRPATPIDADSKPRSTEAPEKSFNGSQEAEKKRQTGDISTWIYYVKAIGRVPLLFFVLFIVLASLGAEFPKLLLKWSTEEGFNVGKFIGLYAMLSLIAWAAQSAMIA
jgi:ATP-binding cassette subfamily C (CFTR/MRP) protein 1